MLSKIFLWLLVIGSLGGQVLITKKRRIGFMLWVIVDIGWSVLWLSKLNVPGAFEQGILWVVYTAVSLWGWFVYKEQK